MQIGTVFIVVCLLAIFGTIRTKICLREPRCYCTLDSKTHGTKIFCKDVEDVSNIKTLLKNFTSVYSLRIYGDFLSDLPSNAFGSASINILEISAPLSNVSPDALTSIKDLEILNIEGANFTRIPSGVSVPSLRIMELTNGSLTQITNELLQMNITTDFLLNRNHLSHVSNTAFLGAISMEYLDLSNNQLTFLDSRSFVSNLQLKNLNLGYNQLDNVDGLFATLNPETINLYGNNLSNIDKVFHTNMWKTKNLDLGGNPYLNLSGINFPMKYLYTLSLNQIGFEELDSSSITNLHYLRELFLNDNNLTSLPTDFFIHMLYFKVIEIKNNKLKSMKDLFSFSNSSFVLTKLEYVSVSGNRMSTVDLDGSFKNVRHLDLSRNQLDHIRKTDFEHLLSLELLNFSGNPLTQMEIGCFQDLSKLSRLDLSHSKIDSLNGMLQNLNELSHLDVSSSLLVSIDETELSGLTRLEYVYLNNNSLISIEKAFKNNVDLRTLNIADNNLTILTADTFPESNRNHSLHWEKIWMEGNPWSCDCRISWLIDWLHENHSRLEDEPKCHNPPNLSGVEIRNLNHSILERWEQDCPEQCFCNCIPETDIALSIVNCSNRDLTEQPHIFPENAKVIDLSGNKLISFTGFQMTDFSRLETLNLSNNDLTEFELEGPVSITNLYLDGNNFTSINFSEWKETSLKRITLSGNPWKCVCETWEFRQWIMLHNLSIPDIDEIRCSTIGKFSKKSIIHLSYYDLCPDLSSKGLAAPIAVTSVVIILLISVLIYFFRHSLLAILYSCGCTCLKKEEYVRYPYDAFLLYADEDDDFALGDISDELERSGDYTLFVPTRQILLTSSPVSVNSSIADCCKIIVILTSDFLRNTQCMHLLKTAMSYSMESSYRRFIFITKEKLPPEIEFDLVLDALVKKSLHLHWGEFLFWIKLRYNLPKKARSSDGDDEENGRLLQQPN